MKDKEASSKRKNEDELEGKKSEGKKLVGMRETSFPLQKNRTFLSLQ